jgi:DNA-binding SARP family transcriptional activator/tetratricopeptide (TPR) repeat protein
MGRDYRVLGPLEVRAGERPVPVSGRRRRALLARLLVDANHVVSVDRLVEDLWSEEASLPSDNALQALVSRLRADLAPLGGHDPIITRPPGYMIRTEPGELDLARFQRSVAVAREQRDAGYVEEAAASLASALSSWRGMALAEFDGELWARPAIEAMREARVAAQEEWFDLELQLGHHSQLIAVLERESDAEPLRERTHAIRMLALYRSGRQAEALDVCRALRRRLVDELGIDPTPAIRELETDILNQAPHLDWKPQASTRFPADLRIVQTGGTLVGRAEELERCRRAWRVASAGSRKLLLVSGEPGIGKTHLVAQFAKDVHDAGHLVLYGRCTGDGAGPYQPIIDSLGPIVAARPRSDATSILGRLFPELSGEDTRSTLDAERFVLFEEMRSLLADVSRARPILLIMDDLHWASVPTLLLLRHILLSSTAMPMLVIGTFRDTELTPGLEDWLADLAVDQAVDRLPLSGLSAAQSSELVNDELGFLTETIHARTGGNPFFIREIVRHLRETATVHDPSQLSRLAIPEGVRAVIRRRLARLSSGARLALTAMAAANEMLASSLRRLPSLASSDLAAALDEVIRARLVVQPGRGRYAVAHALIAQVVLAEIGDARLGELHAEIALSLDRLPGASEGALAAQARHWADAFLLGADVDADLAVARIELAALEALDQLAYEDAVEHVKRGLQILDETEVADHEMRPRMLLNLSRSQIWLGDEESCMHTTLELADAARAAGSAALLAQGALLRSSMAVYIPDPMTEAMLNDALGSLPEEEYGLRAELMAGLAEYHCRELSEGTKAGPIAVEALSGARASGDNAAIGRALSARAMTLLGTPHMEELLRIGGEMIARGHGMAIASGTYGHVYRAVARLAKGDLSGFIADAHEVEAWGHARRKHATIGVASQCLSVAAHIQGRLADAERLADEVVAWSPTQIHEGTRLMLRLFIRREQKRCREIEAPLEQLLTHYPKQSGARALSVYFAFEASDLSRAREIVDRFAANDFSSLDGDILRPCALVALAEAAATLHDRERASVLCELLRPFAGQLIVMFDGASCLGTADRHLGMLAATLERFDEAEHWFSSALALEERIGAPLFAARTRRWYARALSARGETERARRMEYEADAVASP